MGKEISIVEVGPRDGFQNVKEFIRTEFKLEIIDGLAASGIQKIQCTSFVSPKAIPQMQDAEIVAKTAVEKYPHIAMYALVPNFRGAENAVACGIKEVSPVISLSVSHNQANVRKTHQESIEEIKKIRQEFPDLKMMVDIATVFACPFEGKMEIQPLLDMIGKIHQLGIQEFTLCDTIGMAHPAQVKDVIQAARNAFADCTWGIHVHDTRNMGILNSFVALECGINSVQATLGGLGGCPFAPGASGNTATEDFVYAVEQDGYRTGISFEKLLETAKKLHERVEGNYSGHHINIKVKTPD